MASNDPLAQAQAYDDAPEVSWRPRPGDVVGGRVVDFDRRTTAYEPDVPVVILEQPDGERIAVWLLHTVLRAEMKKLRPKIGDMIAIRRLDDAADGGYARYKVFAEDEDPFDWDAVQADAGDVPSDGQRMTPYARQAMEADDGLPI